MVGKRLSRWTIALLGLVGIGFLVWRLAVPKPVMIRYTTAKVDTGDIRAYVTATGTVNPILMVDVSTQVSGMIKHLYVDINAKVGKGDPLAEVDPSPFLARLKQAKANLKKALEEVQMTRKIMRENADLYRRALMSKEEYTASQSKYAVAQATYEERQAALEIAQSELDSTTIRSPIDGVVVALNVNVGQTVSASLQTPTLFLIAQALTQMKLDTNVSEADIGKVDIGQAAFFNVDAYPGEPFDGRVWQIRNIPETVQNVVTYDVVLRVENPELKLKPGMTAEVNILVASRQHTLRVPRAALRFTPPAGARLPDDVGAVRDATVVWTLAPSGQLQAVPIQTGISDEQYTELVGTALREGDEVVIEAAVEGASGTKPLGSVLPQPKRF
jgi:HlyD family secretion protein